MKKTKKIDIHCHTTNRKVNGVIPLSADLSEIQKQMKLYNSEKTVVLATYFPHKGTGISNYRLLNWIKDKPEFLMFGSLDFQNYFYQGLNELEELAEQKSIKGIKIYTSYQNIDLHSDNFKKIILLAETYKLPLMFHTGYSYTAKRKYGKDTIAQYVNASDLRFIVDNYDVRVIASHLSKPHFDNVIETAKSNKNFYSDTSGIFDSKFDQHYIPTAIENIKRFLDIVGPSQLMFGTDFPVQTHHDSVYIIEEAMKHYSTNDKENVYYNNVKKLLNFGGKNY
jgi:predicted TIM-barrel fold metal-dependent hydrolase